MSLDKKLSLLTTLPLHWTYTFLYHIHPLPLEGSVTLTATICIKTNRVNHHNAILVHMPCAHFTAGWTGEQYQLVSRPGFEQETLSSYHNNKNVEVS